MNRNILPFLFLIVLISCKVKKSDPVWSDLPEVKDLADLKQTAFVPTLENPINEHKNIVYAPAFLYAWDLLKGEYEGSMVPVPPSYEFELLMKSTSYQNSLNKEEYSADILVEGDQVTAKAFFRATLPFETKMEKLTEPLLFNGEKVAAFGMHFYNEKVAGNCYLLYYENDDKFVLKLQPENPEHEIILVKGLDKMTSLAQAVAATNRLINKGKKEMEDDEQWWKFNLLEEDTLSIPAIKFNVITHYGQLEGQQFFGKGKSRMIVEAFQRTGFILDENGAVVESEAAILDSAAAAIGGIHPKKLIFDEPFYIIIKRTDKVNPYFVMKVENTELMTEK